MTWEEKLAALSALSRCSLQMRAPGNWYVEQPGVFISKGDGFLHGSYGNGRTPEEAVDAHWAIYSAVTPASGATIVVESGGARREYVWAGVLWREWK